MLTFEQYADFLTRSAGRVEPVIGIGLARVGTHALSLASEYVGHQMEEWDPLSAGYVAQKRRQGYTGRVSATDPWLRTGASLASLGTEVHGHEVVLGAGTQQAVWTELGTSKMPPRPLLALAMQNAQEFAGDVFGEAAVALLVPPGARI